MGVLPEESVAVDPRGHRISAGAFAVTKKGDILRLITDRRPWNFWEQDLEGLQLPHGLMFTKLELKLSEMLRLNLRDASIYYYLLKVPEARLPYQGVGPLISKEWWDADCPDLGADWRLAYESPSGRLLQPVMLVICHGGPKWGAH